MENKWVKAIQRRGLRPDSNVVRQAASASIWIEYYEAINYFIPEWQGCTSSTLRVTWLLLSQSSLFCNKLWQMERVLEWWHAGNISW